MYNVCLCHHTMQNIIREIQTLQTLHLITKTSKINYNNKLFAFDKYHYTHSLDFLIDH